VWCDKQLRIVPKNQALELRLGRYEPDRGIGEGEALLSLRCAAPGSEQTVEVPIARSYGMYSLDDVALEVSVFLSMELHQQDVW
jgi:hypothetical protein